ncbi:uncharacterized protein LOC144205762 [Stigmatopora nigra]
MSTVSMSNLSQGLALDASGNRPVILGSPDGAVVGNSGAQTVNDIVAATIRLDHLSPDEVQNFLKVLQPYDNNMHVVTKKQIGTSASLNSLGYGIQEPAGTLNGDWGKADLDVSTQSPVSAFDSPTAMLQAAQGLRTQLNGSVGNELPNVNLTEPSADAEFTSPSLAKLGSDLNGTLTTGELTAPSLANLGSDVNGTLTAGEFMAPSLAKLGSGLDGALTTGEFMAPSLAKLGSGLDGSLPTGEFTAPSLAKLGSGLDGNLTTGEFTAPSLAKPGSGLDGTLTTGEFTAPSLAKLGSGLDGTLTTGEVTAPSLAGLASPHIVNSGASLDINKPHLKSGNLNYKAPDFTMPKFGLPPVKIPAIDGDLNLPSVNGETKGLDMSLPNLDITSPNVGLNGPNVDLKGHDVNIDSPRADIGVSSEPFKWGQLRGKLKKPKLPGAKADLNLDADLKTPGADLSLPKLEGGLDAPNIDVNLPTADLKGPDLDIQPLNIEGPSGKFVWPHQKWKKPKLRGLKGDFDGDIGLNKPDLNLSKPKLDAQLDLPKADFKGPNIDVKTPNLDIDTPSVKKNWHLNLKKPKLPNLNPPNIDLPRGSIDAGIDAPDVNLNLPKANLDVDAPDLDIGAPSGRIKFPTMKRPKFRFAGPKMKTRSLDLDTPDLSLSSPDASLHGPDLNLPKADVDVKVPDVDASLKTKWPTLKKPKWAISGPKINGPDLDTRVSTPDLNLTAPDLDGELNAPDLNLNGPKLDIDAGVPSGKFKWFKKPMFGTLRGLKSEIDGDIKVPDVDLKPSDLDLTGPDLNINGPSLDVQTPDAHIEPIDGKLKFLKLKMPKWPKMKDADLDTNIKRPSFDANLDVPNLDLETPDLSISPSKLGGSLDTPDIDLHSPGLSSGNVKFPKIKLPTLSGLKLEKPNLDLNTDVKAPKLDVASPDAEIGGGFVSPDLSLPDLNGSTSLNLSAPSLSTKLPNGELEAPDVKLNGPDANLKTPLVGLNSYSGDFKMPHYKVPNLELSGSEVEVPSPHHSVQAGLETPNVNVGVPNADINGPKITGGIKVPELDVESPKVDASLEKNKLPHFKWPNLSFSGAKIKTPEVNTSPKLSLEGTDTPEIAIKGSPKSKLKWPFKWGFRSNSEDTDEHEGDAETPRFRTHTLPKAFMDTKSETQDFFSQSKAEIEARDYVVSKGVRLPVVNVPTRNGERVDIMERLKMAQEKVSSTHSTPTEDKTLYLKMAPPTLDANGETGDSGLVRGGTFKVENPESPLGLKVPGFSSEHENTKLSLGLSNMLGLDVN